MRDLILEVPKYITENTIDFYKHRWGMVYTYLKKQTKKQKPFLYKLLILEILNLNKL